MNRLLRYAMHLPIPRARARVLAGCGSSGGAIRSASPTPSMILGHLELSEEVRDETRWIHASRHGEAPAP